MLQAAPCQRQSVAGMQRARGASAGTSGSGARSRGRARHGGRGSARGSARQRGGRGGGRWADWRSRGAAVAASSLHDPPPFAEREWSTSEAAITATNTTASFRVMSYNILSQVRF